MKIYCTKCGKSRRRATPSDLAKHGTTEETYLCRACTLKKPRKPHRPDYSQLKKIKEWAKRGKQ